MGCTVEELLTVKKLSSLELTYWIAHFAREPWGGEVENWRMGMTCAQIVNMTPRGKGAKTLQPTDFYVSPHAKDESFTPEQLAFIAKNRKKKPKR